VCIKKYIGEVSDEEGVSARTRDMLQFTGYIHPDKKRGPKPP